MPVLDPNAQLCQAYPTACQAKDDDGEICFLAFTNFSQANPNEMDCLPIVKLPLVIKILIKPNCLPTYAHSII